MARSILLALAIAAVAACSPRPGAGSQAPARGGTADASAAAPQVVDGPAARALVGAGARVVDVRTPQEFSAGHVPGAVNIPFDQMGSRAGEIGPPETPVVVYCQSGRRSALAAETLRGLGYGRVYDLRRYDAWGPDQ